LVIENFMPEIIPAIIARSFDELKEKVKLVEPYVSTVQLDIMDGIFVSNETWRTPEDLNNLETNLFLEAHLMVVNPYDVIEGWLASKVRKVLIHWESLDKRVDFELSIIDLMEKVRLQNKKLGIVLNPETPMDVLDSFISQIDLVMLMGVSPGFAGQQIQPGVVDKVRQLRQKYLNVKIEIDGGVNSQNARQLVFAGADFLAVGASIFESGDIGKAIKLLEESII